MKKNVCLCVAGWHFHEPVYKLLSEAVTADVFAVVHKIREGTPIFLREFITEEHILFRDNIGYDWGCYQQFIAERLWLDYEYVFFMHDDLVIKSLEFLPHTVEMLNEGNRVVGNGRNSPHRSWPQTHLFCYGHSTWQPPDRQFQHDTVRGSFLAMKTKTLADIDHFEIFWDPYHLNIRFGNHSLIATCGKIQSIFGDNAFGFLSENYLDSEYITEVARGGQNVLPPAPGQRIVVNLYNKLASYYVAKRMNQSNGLFFHLAALIISKMSGVY
ncbi:MAG: hypothetical protein H6667_21735 [Ardenticatenaceae bacterium]|nr:hypothetical protein [Ardenticatenaceae bacterium]